MAQLCARRADGHVHTCMVTEMKSALGAEDIWGKREKKGQGKGRATRVHGAAKRCAIAENAKGITVNGCHWNLEIAGQLMST